MIEDTGRSDRELMSMHVEALFRHDAQSRLKSVNVPSGGRAPRFFLGRTKDGPVWRFRADLPRGLVARLEALCADEPVPESFHDEPKHADAYAELLEEHAPAGTVRSGPAYYVPETVAPPSSRPIEVTEDNAEVLRPGLEEWIPDVPSAQPFLAIVAGNRAVSVCCSVRDTPDAHEAGVETASGDRGNGYATDAVSAWADAVRDEGCIPLYSTSRENVASQGLANRVGLVQYGVDFQIA